MTVRALAAAIGALALATPGIGAKGEDASVEAGCNVSQQARSDYAAFETDRLAGEARRARLRAELNEDKDIAFPAELSARTSDPRALRLMNDERLVFEKRAMNLSAQIGDAEKAARVAKLDAKYAQQKLDVLEPHLVQLKSHLADLDKLVASGQGLAGQRIYYAQRLLDYQMMRVDLQFGMERLREDLARMQQSLADLRRQRKIDLLLDLSQAEAQIVEAREKNAALLASVRKPANCLVSN